MARVARLLIPATALALGVSTLAPATSAEAHGKPTTSVVATGLDNPRLLSFDSSGALYVAKSGRGGDGPCFDGPEGRACLGDSGAVTRVGHHGQRRVITGLPSLAGEGGAQATGPSDVIVQRDRYTVSIGLGGTPATRTSLGDGAELLGTVVTGRFGGNPRVAADLATYEEREDPDGAGSDSNTVALFADGWGRGRVLAVDAGGNDVLRLSGRGRVSTVAVLPPAVTTNPFTGAPMQSQSVPTSVVRGPDGALYVSELVGFPFPKGAARIWRIGHRGVPSVWATGLTNVTDLAWYHGSLYAVQLTDNGLLSQSSGSLVRVAAGSTSPEVVADGLTMPYGVALRDRAAYVTVCSVCAGGGQVVRIRLSSR